MHREFAGRFLALDEAIEDREVRLLFEDSWYWLHYRFFNCRDAIASESSSAVRTHLYNFAAMIYRGFDDFLGTCGLSEVDLQSFIREIVEISEYSREFPISLWISGDETSKTFLDERLSPLPPTLARSSPTPPRCRNPDPSPAAANLPSPAARNHTAGR